MRELDEIKSTIIGAAIRIHSHLGPGLLESAYQKCLRYELEEQGIRVEIEVPIPILYRKVAIEVGYRADMIVENCILVENKAVERIAPVHEAQLLTYLRLSGLHLGYILNWNVPVLKNGIRRMVNNLKS